MRRKMEDKHVCIPDFNILFNIEEQEEQAYFAVFDGHGGVDAAIYAALHLHVNFVRQETFSVDPSEALCAAFRVTDERFVQKAARENIRCGTTGVVTFIKGNMLHVAWLGDSQVMLVKKGQAVELMKPHKPDREDEKQRIEALGGCVVWFGAWRVNGSLSVSRAIGDAEHKPYICGEADSTTVVLDGTEDYLILACDGFYDTVSPEEAVKVVSDHLKENNGDNSMVAHKLVASARDAGSSDNITVIVVFLRDMNTTENVSQDSNWTENSFEGGQDDNGDDKENHGDCKASRPLHQCSAPADLGYDDRENSFTDRTSLNLGPKMNLVDDQGYLDLMQGGASMPRSAKCLPSTQVFSSGIPKKVHLVNKILKAQPSESSLAKGHRRVRESLENSSLWQIYRMNCSPSFYWGVPYEQFETPWKCASLVHLYYPKRRRGTKGKPKLQALLFPQGLIHKAGSRRSRLVWSSTGKGVLRSSIPRKQTTPKGYCEKAAVALILKESNSIPSTNFHNSCKI